eukprot:UN17750
MEVLDKSKWQPDKDVDICGLCSNKLTRTKWRHHCRFCGCVVCDNCSKKRLENERICDKCQKYFLT